jgi:hypothetical protein
LSLQETTEITFEDERALRDAVKALEHPSLAGRLTNIVGKPVEVIGMALPAFASKAIASATSKGLEAALKVALRTLPSSSWPHSQPLHRRRRRDVRTRCPAGRVACVHRHHAAVDRGHRAQRGRGPV